MTSTEPSPSRRPSGVDPQYTSDISTSVMAHGITAGVEVVVVSLPGDHPSSPGLTWLRIGNLSVCTEERGREGLDVIASILERATRAVEEALRADAV